MCFGRAIRTSNLSFLSSQFSQERRNICLAKAYLTPIRCQILEGLFQAGYILGNFATLIPKIEKESSIGYEKMKLIDSKMTRNHSGNLNNLFSST